MLILKWFSEKFPLKNQQLSTIIISKSTSASKKVNCQTDGSGWDFKISPCDLLCFKYSWMYILLLHSSQISGLRLMKCSSKMLQNLLYFMCMKTHVVFLGPFPSVSQEYSVKRNKWIYPHIQFATKAKIKFLLILCFWIWNFYHSTFYLVNTKVRK